VKVLGAAFVMLMNLRYSSARRPGCGKGCSARAHAKRTFALPTVPGAMWDEPHQRYDSGSESSCELWNR
jgi:hypothetical protein